MIVYFLVLTFWYGSQSPSTTIIPQTYQTKEACEAAAMSSISEYNKRSGFRDVDFMCVPWNQEGD